MFAELGRRLSPNRRGSVLLEFAIVLPVILLMMIGMVDLARAFNIWQVVVNAARVGARIVALPPGTQSNQDLLDARITEYLESNGLEAGEQCTWSNSAFDGAPGSQAWVTVSCDHTFIALAGVLQLVGSSGPPGVTLTSTSRMRNE